MGKLKIAYVASEAIPYSKTGGLADVAGALPQQLADLKHRVALFTPLYRSVSVDRFDIFRIAELSDLGVWVGGREWKFNVLARQDSIKSKVETYFIECDELFDREGLYVDPATGKDHTDNHIRFAFFARAVLLALEKLNFRPDIINANDWQAALIPAYLKTAERDHPFFKGTRTVLTIHNVAYQGIFPAESFSDLGIHKSYFYPTSPFEYWGKVNFLKSGIVFADAVTTVSETYAQEIQSSNEFGYGLEGVLHDRRNVLYGVINGVDYDIWSPKTDRLIVQQYDVDTINEKQVNKDALLRTVGLSLERSRKPLIGIISRLADQKGFDLIEEISEELFAMDVTFVLLGTGQEKYHELFEKLAKQYRDRISVNLKFDERLAHMIEAGADMFLMPSRFEPCGLNQLYSLRYGTVPIARKTGGLADSIVDYNASKTGSTGFLFEEYEAPALLDAIKRALAVYEKQTTWKSLMKRGMKKDFSWKKSAKRYLEIYSDLLGGAQPVKRPAVRKREAVKKA